MYLIIDNTSQEPELKAELSSMDRDDADMDIITIIDLVGTPKKNILVYIKGGSWEIVKGRIE